MKTNSRAPEISPVFSKKSSWVYTHAPSYRRFLKPSAAYPLKHSCSLPWQKKTMVKNISKTSRVINNWSSLDWETKWFMTLFAISCFSLTLFLCTLILHSPLVRSSTEVVRSQVFTRLRVLKSAPQYKKNKAKQLTVHVEQQVRTYSNDILFHLTTCSLTFWSSFKFFLILRYVRVLMQKNFTLYV